MQNNVFRQKIYTILDEAGITAKAIVAPERAEEIATLLAQELGLPITAKAIRGLGRQALVGDIQALIVRQKRLNG